MNFGHAVRVSITIPLLLAATACVPQDNAPKATNVAAPAVSTAPAAPAPAPPSAASASAPAAATSPAVAVPKTPAPSATKTITDLTVPRSGIGTATYRCGNGGMITIQNLGSSLRVVRPDGTAEEFAASPANQSSRYQEATTHDAIVIDGREALVMKRGSTPQTCRR